MGGYRGSKEYADVVEEEGEGDVEEDENADEEAEGIWHGRFRHCGSGGDGLWFAGRMG
jgi:hypothetical protein